MPASPLQLAKSKVSWFSEHRAEKEAAVKAAVSTIERHWQQKWDGDMEQEVQAKVFTGQWDTDGGLAAKFPYWWLSAWL